MTKRLLWLAAGLSIAATLYAWIKWRLATRPAP